MKSVTALCLWMFLVSWAFAAGPHGDVHLTWDRTSGAAGYKIYWRPVPSEMSPRHIDVGNRTDYDLTQLTDCTTNWIAVTAYKGPIESAYSADQLMLWPRPRLTSLVCEEDPDSDELDSTFVADCTLDGVNFRSDAELAFLGSAAGDLPAGFELENVRVTVPCYQMKFRLVLGENINRDYLQQLQVRVSNQGQLKSRTTEYSPFPPQPPAAITNHPNADGLSSP